MTTATKVEIKYNYNKIKKLRIKDLSAYTAYIVTKGELFNEGDIVVCGVGLDMGRCIVTRLNDLGTWIWDKEPCFKDEFIPMKKLVVDVEV